ncbi:hypothetical protein SAMN05216284_103162 [Micromonospora sediminimaris]|nr:hypothetical protein SAMN05216284_103162 [Micromonospora sediminimaris]
MSRTPFLWAVARPGRHRGPVRLPRQLRTSDGAADYQAPGDGGDLGWTIATP